MTEVNLQIQRASVLALIESAEIETGREQRITSEQLETNGAAQQALQQQIQALQDELQRRVKELEAEIQGRAAPIQTELQTLQQEVQTLQNEFGKREQMRRGRIDGLKTLLEE